MEGLGRREYPVPWALDELSKLGSGAFWTPNELDPVSKEGFRRPRTSMALKAFLASNQLVEQFQAV